MSQELDKYLQGVAHELRGLEAEQRDAEVREMRGHLEAIVARLVEGGLSESEAAEAACAQFGAPSGIGRGIQRAGGQTPQQEVLLASLAAWVTGLGFFGAGEWFFTKFPTLIGDVGMLPLAWLIGFGPLCGGWLAESIAPRRGGIVSACAYTMMLASFTLLAHQPITPIGRLAPVAIACIGVGLRRLTRNEQRTPLAPE